MPVHRVEQRLKASEPLKYWPRSGRTQIIWSQEVIKKVFEDDPCQKITRLVQKKKISLSTMSTMIKKLGEKSVRCSRKPLLSAAMVQKCFFAKWPEKLPESNSNFSHEKTFIVDSVFNKQNDRVVSFRIDISKHRRVSTTKHPPSIMILGTVVSIGEKLPIFWFERGYRLSCAL